MFEVDSFEPGHAHLARFGEILRIRLVAARRAVVARTGTALSQVRKIRTAPVALPRITIEAPRRRSRMFHETAGSLRSPGPGRITLVSGSAPTLVNAEEPRS